MSTLKSGKQHSVVLQFVSCHVYPSNYSVPAYQKRCMLNSLNGHCSEIQLNTRQTWQRAGVKILLDEFSTGDFSLS